MEKSKQGLCSQDDSPLLYGPEVSPPVIQHLVPVAAAFIVDFAGVPHAQSEPDPPGSQPPLVVSKPSVYGNEEMGVPHCALDLPAMQNEQTKK